MSSRLEVQAAMNTALTNDSAVSAIVSDRIYDRAPQNVAYPWIQLGAAQVLPYRAQGYPQGEQVYAEIHTWSQSPSGTVEASDLNDAIKAALDRNILPLASLKTQECLFISDQVFRDADGETTHGVVTFRVTVTPAAVAV